MTKVTIQLSNTLGMRFALISLTEHETYITLPGTDRAITVPFNIWKLRDRWIEWQAGALIQNVFAGFTADEREFLMTGITPEEWIEITKEMES